MIRVVVADDQEIVRTGLKMILDAQPGIEVVGEAADGRAAVALARVAAARRVPVRHPHAGARRHRGDAAARRPGRRGPAGGRRHHHVRPRRVRARRAEGRRARLPAEGRRPRAARPGDPLGRQRRRPDRPERDGAAARRVLRRVLRTAAAPAARAVDRARGGGARAGRARADQRRDRRRAVHQPQHDQDPPREPDEQARRPQPGRAGDVGLRDRPHRPLGLRAQRPAYPHPHDLSKVSRRDADVRAQRDPCRPVLGVPRAVPGPWGARAPGAGRGELLRRWWWWRRIRAASAGASEPQPEPWSRPRQLLARRQALQEAQEELPRGAVRLAGERRDLELAEQRQLGIRARVAGAREGATDQSCGAGAGLEP